MRFWRTIIAGIAAGALAIAIVGGAGWLSGVDADLCMLLGAVVTGDTGTTTWLVGGLGQLLVAVVAAIIYAIIFEWVTRRAGAVIGVLIAIPHVVVAGLAVGFLSGSRLLEAGILPPGAFMEYRGAVVLVGFVLAHLVFGTLVGASYGRTRHVVPATMTIWHDVTDASRGHSAQG